MTKDLEDWTSSSSSSSGIEFHQIETEWAKSKPSAYERMFVKLKQKTGKDLTVGVIYRAPGDGIDLFRPRI